MATEKVNKNPYLTPASGFDGPAAPAPTPLELMAEHPQFTGSRYAADASWEHALDISAGTKLIQLCATKDDGSPLTDFYVRLVDAARIGYDPKTQTVDATQFSKAMQIRSFIDKDDTASYMPYTRVVTVESDGIGALKCVPRENSAYGDSADVEQIYIPGSEQLCSGGLLSVGGCSATRNRMPSEDDKAFNTKIAQQLSRGEAHALRGQLVDELYMRNRLEADPASASGEAQKSLDSRNTSIENVQSLLEKHELPPEEGSANFRHEQYLTAQHEARVQGKHFESDPGLENEIQLLHEQRVNVYRQQEEALYGPVIAADGIQDALEQGMVVDPFKVEDMADARYTAVKDRLKAYEQFDRESDFRAAHGYPPPREFLFIEAEQDAPDRRELNSAEEAAQVFISPAAEQSALDRAAPDETELTEKAPSAMEEAAPDQSESIGKSSTSMERIAPDNAESAQKAQSAMEMAAPEAPAQQSQANAIGQTQSASQSMGE